MQFSIEIEDSELTFKGLRATTRFFDVLASNHQLYKNVNAIVTGIDSPFLNVAYLGHVDINDMHDICQNMSDFFSHYQIPWTMVMTSLSLPLSLPEQLEREKFGLIESVPCMYCDLSKMDPYSPNTELVIKQLLSSDNLIDWIKPICEGFEAEDGGEEFRKLNAKVSEQSGVFKQFVAFIESEVVSSGTLFMVDDVAMIHNIATKTASLKKGYGTSLTQYLMNVAKELGYKHCFLEASESGYNIYRKCGFRVYGVNHYYVKKQ
jgi:predicted GNAT family acetyltransferase